MTGSKGALRSELLAARTRLSTEERAAASHAITGRVQEVPGFAAARVLAVYAPIGAEVDPGELVVRAAARGVALVYPRSLRGERRLAFVRAVPGDLAPGPLGALEPPEDAPEVAAADVDAVLVPCVGVSEDGGRLGRGGGYYDATLPALSRAIRIGLAFEAQLVPALPREAHDAPLDAAVTEARVLLFTRDRASHGASTT